jgi:UDPglucose 6-dehydrogenase
MNVVVYGLWHLGCVTAACLAEAGFRVTGLDRDEKVVHELRRGCPPLHEPGMDELIQCQAEAGRLRFTSDPAAALSGAEVLWVTFDTPVNDRDEADVEFVRGELRAVVDSIAPGTLVLISSQVPVGFTTSLEREWAGRGIRFAVSPENLRLGKALECFRKPDRVIVGRREASDEATLANLFEPFCRRVEWMSVESAEMTKHALNAFLATSVTFINEVARVCEAVGADAKEVERGLKSESRIGPKAYLSPGGAFAGGTLARDVRFLIETGQRRSVGTPLFQGVLASNDVHKDWTRQTVLRLAASNPNAVVAVLGLTYKPGTNTLRRSSSVELCHWLRQVGLKVRAHDPAITERPVELPEGVVLCGSSGEALIGTDVAVVATEWPDYRALSAADVVGLMRRPQVIDQTHFLASALSGDARVSYHAAGRRAAA